MFSTKTKPFCEDFLKKRGIKTTGYKVAALRELCQLASTLQYQYDPDGVEESREGIITEKLTTDDGVQLEDPSTLKNGSQDLSALPQVTIVDLYSYFSQSPRLEDDFSAGSFREYTKMEGYTMARDGHVRLLEVFHSTKDIKYWLIKGQIKPRTKATDSLTKKACYDCWIIMKDNKLGAVHSAMCSCKGGMDGHCRHTACLLFDIMETIQEHKQVTCTSRECQWRIRAPADHTEKLLATELDTSIKPLVLLPPPVPTDLSPVPDNACLPTADDLVEMLKTCAPKSCILPSYNVSIPAVIVPELTVPTPVKKYEQFTLDHKCHEENCQCSLEFVETALSYSQEDVKHIEEATRGQSQNENWHKCRVGMLTSSRYHEICHARDKNLKAQRLLQPSRINQDNPPKAIEYGRKKEEVGRKNFIKVHRYLKGHSKCKVRVPGLLMDTHNPFLASSTDGVVSCKQSGKFLLEVKALYARRNQHPKQAALESGIITESEDGILHLNADHKFSYQIQGQMATYNVERCQLVLVTDVTQCEVTVHFDRQAWDTIASELQSFYHQHYFPAVMSFVSANMAKRSRKTDNTIDNDII